MKDLAFDTLLGVNPLPKQTWNYLKINDTEVKVDHSDARCCCIPSREMAELPMGCGVEVTRYLDRCASARRLVNIEPDTVSDKPIEIDIDDKTPRGSCDIIVGANSKIVLSISSTSTEEHPETLGNNLRIVMRPNSQVKVVSVSHTSQEATYMENIGVSMADGCTFTSEQFFLGGGKTYTGCQIQAAGDDSTFSCFTHYLTHRDELLDCNYVAQVSGERNTGAIYGQGVLEDGSNKTMRQTIDLMHGCKGSQGQEHEHVLLVGSNMVNKTIPVLLCHEDEVSGDHGASIGSVSESQLDYLKDRGLNDQEIMELFASSVVDQAARATVEGTRAHQVALEAGNHSL